MTDPVAEQELRETVQDIRDVITGRLTSHQQVVLALDSLDVLSARLAQECALRAQAEQERDEARKAANEAFVSVTAARAEVADARERLARRRDG